MIITGNALFLIPIQFEHDLVFVKPFLNNYWIMCKKKITIV